MKAVAAETTTAAEHQPQQLLLLQLQQLQQLHPWLQQQCRQRRQQ
jgi:hypothetical protein